MAETLWTLESIPALAWDRWAQPTSWFGLVWFSLVHFWGKHFQTEVPGVRHQRCGCRGWAALPSLLLEGRRDSRCPQAQGKVTTTYTCWGAQQMPFSPEVLNKSCWLEGVKIQTWMANFGSLPFANLAFWLWLCLQTFLLQPYKPGKGPEQWCSYLTAWSEQKV